MADDTIILPPVSGTARSSLICLHGLGAGGADLIPVAEALLTLSPAMTATRFIFPQAPARPVAIHGGVRLPAWYDVPDEDFGMNEDRDGLNEAAAGIDRLIEAEDKAGVPPERIVLSGFSQGGALTLHAGLRHPRRLAGLLVMSGYLPLANDLDKQAAPANRPTPILMLHGSLDPIIPVSLARQARERLIGAGYDVQWRHYPVEHTVCPEEIQTMRNWLAQRPGI